MKYLKTYQIFEIAYTNINGKMLKWGEDLRSPSAEEPKYRSGDYIFTTITFYGSFFDAPGIVVKADSVYNDETYYNIEYYSEEDNRFSTAYVGDHNIIRFLTPEEIENYEFKKSASKYNL